MPQKVLPLLPASELWSPSDRTRVIGANVVGALGILVGWIGVAAETDTGDQIFWLDVAIIGVIVAGIGNAGWLVKARRRVGEHVHRTQDAIGDTAPPVRQKRGTPQASDLVAVAARGMTRAHRSDCPLIAGKNVRAVTARRRLLPCGVCQPET